MIQSRTKYSGICNSTFSNYLLAFVVITGYDELQKSLCK